MIQLNVPYESDKHGVKMKVEKIDQSEMTSRGKWNQEAIKDFLLEQHKTFKSNDGFKMPMLEFYKEFYGGSKVIKYASYYCKKHIEDALIDLKIKASASASGNDLKVWFK